MATKKRSSMSSNPLIIPVGILVAIAVAAGVSYYRLPGDVFSAKKDLLQKKYQVMLSPQQEFELAFDNTLEAKTAHIEFVNEVETRITGPTGVSETVENIIKGFATGSTDGSVSQAEYALSSKNNQSQQVIIGAIVTEEGTGYIKGPATGQKWAKFSKEEFEKLDQETPVDASFFGLVALESLFEKEKTLLKSIDKKAIKYVGETVKDGKTYKKFSIDIGVPQFLASINQSESYSDVQKEQISDILNTAIISVEFEVDTQEDVIVQMNSEFKNLTHLVPEEYKKAGISSQHNSNVMATFSRYNVPVELKLPKDEDVILPNERVKGATTPTFDMIEDLR